MGRVEGSEGGRFGRTPYKPEVLEEEYGTTESGRLEVTCPGCGEEWYPTTMCCIDRYAGSPHCPQCGTDFRCEEKVWEPSVKFLPANKVPYANSSDDVTEEVRELEELIDDLPEESEAVRAKFYDIFGDLEDWKWDGNDS